ncbi:bilirubin oxidase [Periconia macrospinosa]|uniref:Bilirubin oxidase n=1 Tax=Periconia macrospinosa TaxID=97972 RepID=A0A2V1E517_9PLEO|nr:bilirubin oxidase [Periconia macrospinosa]
MSFLNISTLFFAFILITQVHGKYLPKSAEIIARSSNETNPSPENEKGWVSPPYRWIFEYPLPISPAKEIKFTWNDPVTGAPIDFYEVELKTFKKQIYPDLPETELQGYDGMSPGPYFAMQRNREAVVRFINSGPTNMSVHVHGQFSRAPFDGWAADYALPGQYKDYYYPNAQSARTIWYHDHVEHKSAESVYHGQEGGYIISDPEEQALNLPSGKHDISLSISSKSYNWDGSLKWNTFGDVLHVNGQPWPYLRVKPRKYRFRLLNGCISRGLFSHPVTTRKLAFSQGERYELVVDFAKYAGKNVTMRNDRDVIDAVDFPATDRVLRFVVDKWINDDTNNGDVPQQLGHVPPIPENVTVEKEFSFTRRNDRGWLINGVGFSDLRNRILTRPMRGSQEIWTFTNGAQSGSHPIHIHLVEFHILSRTGGRNYVEPYEAAGLKDVVWLAPGETVKVVAQYAPWPGVYMFHCHNLIHEDHDMLVAFNVSQLREWGYTDDTLFIDPMQPEFRPKWYNPHKDGTDIAIREKISWFYRFNKIGEQKWQSRMRR